MLSLLLHFLTSRINEFQRAEARQELNPRVTRKKEPKKALEEAKEWVETAGEKKSETKRRNNI
jgi:hypothetical protein